ncbi:hypothetical protein B0G62_104131 [Paraburkholderia eburnea]|uniref:Uncharacterized protein n=1 Tax=Paraburkholderia eburnea TaxID=1189126 RepID=A0A2S4MDN5_9BURK|nr:hypothetical protein B0G62_104131 [Paraburkholderia eburnea]PRZ23702.1 hypothetical protein BX588_104131 [Paraburkholderia eburnea]
MLANGLLRGDPIVISVRAKLAFFAVPNTEG